MTASGRHDSFTPRLPNGRSRRRADCCNGDKERLLPKAKAAVWMEHDRRISPEDPLSAILARRLYPGQRGEHWIMARVRAAAEIEPVSRMLSSSFALPGPIRATGFKNDADPEPCHLGTVPRAKAQSAADFPQSALSAIHQASGSDQLMPVAVDAGSRPFGSGTLASFASAVKWRGCGVLRPCLMRVAYFCDTARERRISAVRTEARRGSITAEYQRSKATRSAA